MKMFSERELKVLKIIGRKKLSLEGISSELFKKGEKPFDSNIAVANTVRRIIKKCEHYTLDWTLEKSRDNKKLLIKKVKETK